MSTRDQHVAHRWHKGDAMFRGPSRMIGDDLALIERLRDNQRALEQSAKHGVEEPARIMRRARELSVESGVPILKSKPSRDDLVEAERVIDNNDLVHAHFLERGARAARAVAQVLRRDAAGYAAHEGTCFLVAPNVVMTNHHVIPNVEVARRSVADFGHELGIDGNQQSSRRWTLDPEIFFATSPRLDVTLVGATADDRSAVTAMNHLTLASDADERLTIGEAVNVIQHPGSDGRSSGLKQVALRENRLIDRDRDVLWYETDTDPGSSGAPAFNDQWALVALHHRAVARRNKAGDPLNKNGTVYQQGDPDDQVDWIANEGIRVSAICRWLKRIRVEHAQAELRDLLLAKGE